MELININSYYFSSSLYTEMEKSLLTKNINFKTYVPVSENYKVRKEIREKPREHVTVSETFNKEDRYLFYLKHNKIKKDFFSKYKLSSSCILHAHSLFSNGYIAYESYKRYKSPYIVAVRSTDINVFFKKMIHLRKLGVKILLNAKKIIFLSNPYLNYCINNYVPMKYRKEIRNKSIVIPNGVNDFWFENKACKIRSINKKNIRIIFVGDCSKRKNLYTLIKACELLRKRKKINTSLTVVGSIKNKRVLRLLNKSKFIEYKGYLRKEDLIMEYNNNDLFVLPSTKETFGLVYVEALSQGLPILYTKNQGFDEQLPEGTVGFGVDCKDKKNITHNIIKVIENYSTYSNNALNNVETFKWDLITDTYLGIYDLVK